MTNHADQGDDRVKLDPQLLFDRSRQSAFDLLKLLVTLATAGVAGYFATLTRYLDPRLASGERNVGWSRSPDGLPMLGTALRGFAHGRTTDARARSLSEAMH